MVEITKLSVGQALDKMRGTNAPTSRLARLDEDLKAVKAETQRLRAMRLGLDRSRRGGSTTADAEEANKGRVTKLKGWGVISGLIIVICVWACWLLWP
jgi:hypothetical protein